MNREEVAMIGFEIIAHVGDGRSKLITALDECNKGNFEEAEKLMKEANECITEAHKSQTEMLQAEARGEEAELGFIMVHAQDHLMTTMLLRDVMKHMVNLYKKVDK
ncbi:MAG: PTS lactose/cellobiose transporter subunit IIA [Clostridiaceae bacterium]|nr:PTS lactose/cellobiose transporter subunit IIA [Clostridiaceae bacterium]